MHTVLLYIYINQQDGQMMTKNKYSEKMLCIKMSFLNFAKQRRCGLAAGRRGFGERSLQFIEIVLQTPIVQ